MGAGSPFVLGHALAGFGILVSMQIIYRHFGLGRRCHPQIEGVVSDELSVRLIQYARSPAKMIGMGMRHNDRVAILDT